MSARRSGQKLKSSGSVMDGTRGTFCVGDVDVVATVEDVVVEW